MKRLIDEEDFPEGFFEKPRPQATEEKGFDEKTCIPVTIHYAEPVRHGKWIRDEFGSKCGHCGLYAYRDKFDKPWESPYCPICGARMDEND